LTSNADIIDAIRAVVPNAAIDLPTGQAGPGAHLDISRINQDTGYQPQYDTHRAAADYLAWLQACHAR
jgi:UDP-glucose 4-epimerase